MALRPVNDTSSLCSDPWSRRSANYVGKIDEGVFFSLDVMSDNHDLHDASERWTVVSLNSDY